MSDPLSLPRLPVPSGWIWPPLEGRTWLEHALVTVAAPLERAPGEWMAESSEGWRLYSSSSWSRFDEAHVALLRQAHVHSELADLLSPRRCLVIDEGRDGYRLWQAVFIERSLWRAVTGALASGDREVITAELHNALRISDRLEARWSKAPWRLPCTLETVGADDASFVSLMPDVDRAASMPSSQLRERLLRQLRSLVVRTLGDEAARIAPFLDG